MLVAILILIALGIVIWLNHRETVIARDAKVARALAVAEYRQLMADEYGTER